jgi:hypothetical protein
MKEIFWAAQGNIEVSLWGILATLTLEEAHGDRLDFAPKLVQEKRGDLQRRGLKIYKSLILKAIWMVLRGEKAPKCGEM